MADFIFIRKTRNAASSAVHILLNIVFAISAVMLTVFTGSPILGLILVAISKWRVFAVRPHYIWPNFKANLLDFIVGVSMVLIAYYSGSNYLALDILLTAIYCVWLIFIKPRTSETANFVQALIAVFFGMTAASIMTSNLDPIIISVLAFVVGYSAGRHIISQTSDDKDFALSTLTCGLIFAEIAWLCNSWMIIYTFGASGIRIPQLAIVLTIFTYVFASARSAAAKNDGDFKFRDILAPIIFGIVVVSVMLIWFSNPIFNI